MFVPTTCLIQPFSSAREVIGLDRFACTLDLRDFLKSLFSISRWDIMLFLLSSHVSSYTFTVMCVCFPFRIIDGLGISLLS